MNDTVKAVLVGVFLLWLAFGTVGLALLGFPGGPESAWDGR